MKIINKKIEKNFNYNYKKFYNFFLYYIILIKVKTLLYLLFY